MKQVYKWVCRLTVLVSSEKKGKVKEVNFSITKTLPFTPHLGLDVEFFGMPIEATPSQVCYVEDGNYFEVFLHIGNTESGDYYGDEDIKVLELFGWTCDE